VDEESRVLSIVILGALMTRKTLKTPDNNNGIQKSTWVKYHVLKFIYDGLIIMHT
jgi:hypothetical protein